MPKVVQITALNPEQVAKQLQIDLQTVRRLLRSGELKGKKIGRIWRVHPQAVEEYLLSGDGVPFSRTA